MLQLLDNSCLSASSILQSMLQLLDITTEQLEAYGPGQLPNPRNGLETPNDH